MTRDDERKGLGSSMARGRKAAHEDPEEHVHQEEDHKIGGEDNEGSAMARSPGAAKSAQSRHQAEDKSSEHGHGEREEVTGGRGIVHKSVDADHAIGRGGAVSVAGAEGESDMASSKANRKEAMEPEREEQEKAAMGRERTVAHKNTMGHGERETKACHTI